MSKPARALLGVLLLAAASCGDDRLRLVGVVERTALELAAPVSEVVVEQPVARGGRVAAGDVVVRLDTAVAEAELRAAEAALAAAEAAARQAAGEYDRVAELHRSRVSTPQSLDAALRQRDEAGALVAERQARLAQANKRRADLTLRALGPGTVDQLPYEVGERVPAGGVVAVVLADAAPWVRVWLPARAVGRAATASAVVEVEGLAGRFAGRLVDVAREPEFTPHYALTERESGHLVYESRVELEDAPADLRPGLPARVELTLATTGGDGG